MSVHLFGKTPLKTEHLKESKVLSTIQMSYFQFDRRAIQMNSHLNYSSGINIVSGLTLDATRITPVLSDSLPVSRIPSLHHPQTPSLTVGFPPSAALQSRNSLTVDATSELRLQDTRTAQGNREIAPRTKGATVVSVSKGKDSQLVPRKSHTFICTDEKIGKGSYGTVYRGRDNLNQEYAFKCCPLTDKGVPNILELTIMKSIRHPSLNSAVEIVATDTEVMIIQELAQCDLANYTRKLTQNYRPSIDTLRNWCFAIADAVGCLHSCQIIHGDIKAGNVLLFKDGTVKLCDFTLSLKKFPSTATFKHSVCTSTHRPPEVLLSREWNEAIDIWSLACTFYEIAYGDLLFPFQKSPGAIRETEKELLRKRSYNAILEWSQRQGIPNPFEVGLYPLEYLTSCPAPEQAQPEYALFNQLLISMLQLDPSKRPTVAQVLTHPFFVRPLATHNYTIISGVEEKLNTAQELQLSRYVGMLVKNNPSLASLTEIIARRAWHLPNVQVKTKVTACFWIASKIVLGYHPEKVSVDAHILLPLERQICNYLHFRFL